MGATSSATCAAPSTGAGGGAAASWADKGTSHTSAKRAKLASAARKREVGIAATRWILLRSGANLFEHQAPLGCGSIAQFRLLHFKSFDHIVDQWRSHSGGQLRAS
jgi:hypothetical protein